MQPRIIRVLKGFVQTGSPAIKNRSRKSLKLLEKNRSEVQGSEVKGNPELTSIVLPLVILQKAGTSMRTTTIRTFKP